MDLVERYVAAVGRQLPGKQAPDIQAELRDELMSRLEAREAELGRPLEQRDVEGVLIEYGHPLVVAGRYRKIQHLIGPEIFPFWWAVIKVMLLAVLGVYAVLLAVGVLTHATPERFNSSVPSILGVMIYLFGLITLVFVAFERFGKAGFLRQWKPRRLPPLGRRGRSAATLCAEIVAGVVFQAWWFGLFRFRDFLPSFFLTVDLAPVWSVWFWPITAYYAVEIAADIFALARPGLVQLHRGVFIARYIGGLAILVGLLRADHWVVVRGDVPAHALTEIQTNFDLGFRVGIGLTIFGMATAIAVEVWRWRRARQAEVLQPA